MYDYLLVDGYNIIYAWTSLKAIANDNLEYARDCLINILSNYQGYNPVIIIVVFDAHMVKRGTRKIHKYNNIFIVYTKEAETADHYIERTVKKINKNYKVRVATSDSLEQIIILGSGAIRVSANELLEEIELSEKEMECNYINNLPVKKNILSDNLSPEAAKWLEDLRFKGL